MFAKKKMAENFSAHTKKVSSLIPKKHNNVCENLYTVPRTMHTNMHLFGIKYIRNLKRH